MSSVFIRHSVTGGALSLKNYLCSPMCPMKHRYTTPSDATITIASGYPHLEALKYIIFGLVDELMPLDEAYGNVWPKNGELVPLFFVCALFIVQFYVLLCGILLGVIGEYLKLYCDIVTAT